MLTVIKRPRVIREYLTYDLEWIPGTLEVRLVGVYDGSEYRCYRTVGAFIQGELTHKNRGKWFYAHAGGLADFQFLLQHFLESSAKWKVRASFSGSSAIIVHVTRGKNSWHFVDSFWLLKDKLRNIGKWVGISKGNEDESVEFYRDAPFSVLREYNELDCIILFKAIQGFEEVLLELGGQLKMTQASCAMELFRRRFLRKDIDTSSAVNETTRKAYFASRVEVITRHCEDAKYFDVNSSFPYAMTFPCPGEFRGSYRVLPKGPYIADVTVEVPECYFPPLPTRMNGRLFFPVGRWRGWFSDIDLKLLRDTGGRICKVHEALAFHPFEDLREYANTLYDLRRKSEGFMKIGCKYLLNSLYGKFAESEWKSGLLLNPSVNPMLNEGRGETTMLFPGVFITERAMPVPHMHVPISVHITAIARRTLYEYMSMSSELHYCDTDGFSTTSDFQKYREEGKGVELGDIKLEKRIVKGEFITQKVYHLEGTDDKGKALTGPDPDEPGKEITTGLKAKGFSRMTLETMEKIKAMDEVSYTRMTRIKELLRAGKTAPEEEVRSKRLRLTAIPKRFFYPDGHSRPWHIDEIKEQL